MSRRPPIDRVSNTQRFLACALLIALGGCSARSALFDRSFADYTLHPTRGQTPAQWAKDLQLCKRAFLKGPEDNAAERFAACIGERRYVMVRRDFCDDMPVPGYCTTRGAERVSTNAIGDW
jgi:hypothetical protein